MKGYSPKSYLNFFHLAPRERPKLQLAKRSGEAVADAHRQKEVAAKASIFGGAQPVDTTKREKEIEDKQMRATPTEHG